MEQRWRSAPLGHGRTEFWFLAQGLKKLGWDTYKIRAKLEDEVIYANSPAERESEVDALMLSILGKHRVLIQDHEAIPQIAIAMPHCPAQ